MLNKINLEALVSEGIVHSMKLQNSVALSLKFALQEKIESNGSLTVSVRV